MRLQNKVAVITGGATGIGRAIAKQYAIEGAHIAILDINDGHGQATASDCDGLFLHCDTGNPDAVRSAFDRIIEAFGEVDVLVTSASYTSGHAPVADMMEAEWRQAMTVSLDGLFYTAKYATQSMMRRGSGAIIHIASVEGMIGAANHAAYVTAKSAIFGLTRSMAIDYGRHGIRVNAISPGIIDSGRSDLEEAKRDPARMRFWQDMTVLGRLGRPDEVATVAAFLASSEASYISGQNIAVDGGWTVGPIARTSQ